MAIFRDLDHNNHCVICGVNAHTINHDPDNIDKPSATMALCKPHAIEVDITKVITLDYPDN